MQRRIWRRALTYIIPLIIYWYTYSSRKGAPDRQGAGTTWVSLSTSWAVPWGQA